MSIIGISDYDSVRAALGIDVDEATVSDDFIALPIYQGAAEQEVIRRDPGAESRTGAELQRIINATVLITAALICQVMPNLRRESFGDYSYSMEANWTARAQELRARADRELAAVLDAANFATLTRPTMFTVASARRGR